MLIDEMEDSKPSMPMELVKAKAVNISKIPNTAAVTEFADIWPDNVDGTDKASNSKIAKEKVGQHRQIYESLDAILVGYERRNMLLGGIR